MDKKKIIATKMLWLNVVNGILKDEFLNLDQTLWLKRKLTQRGLQKNAISLYNENKITIYLLDYIISRIWVYQYQRKNQFSNPVAIFKDKTLDKKNYD